MTRPPAVFRPLLLAAAVLAPLPAAAQVSWTFRGPTWPIARIENAMVYDSVNQRMVMFGGYDHNWNRMNDTWEYNGVAKTWANVTPAVSPSRRQGAAMAYDPPNQRILLFGGSDDAGTVLGDTWEWNAVTKTWTLLSPASPPAPRVGSRMIYDVANARIVLHGGWNSSTGFQFADTWAWNPVSRTWSNLSPAVSGGTFHPRTYHGLVYNTTNNRVTIFGGRSDAGGDLNDLWELNSATNTWINVTPGGPAPSGRGWAGVTYESGNNRLVVAAGWNNVTQTSSADTWAWNGSAWTQLGNLPGSLGRDSHDLEWDPHRGVSVIFGGFDADVPELQGNAWQALGSVVRVRWPPEQDEHSTAVDPLTTAGHHRMFLYGGGSGQMWESGFGGITWRAPIATPVPGALAGRIGHDATYDTPRDRVILFGGRAREQGVVGPAVFGDTWAFQRVPGQSHSWTALAGGPPARYDHAMVYDAARGRVVLFGGRNAAGTPLADTWLFDPAANSWSPAAGGPPARYDHAMAYDPVRGVVVLFGGDNGSVVLGDTWEWNGTAWTQRATTGPSARAGSAITPVPVGCGGTALFGGRTQGGALLDDMWIWNGSGWGPLSQSGPRPSARVNARMEFDHADQWIWLYGGRTARGRSGEVWTSFLGGANAFSVSDVTVGENAGTAIFTISLAPPSAAGGSVVAATSNGTAVAGQDYAPVSANVSFAACQTTATVAVPIVDDLVDEPDETFFLNLSSPSGGTIADGQGQATILDDDPTPAISVQDCAVAEGDAGTTPCTFMVTLSNPKSTAVSAAFATGGGTATAGDDYIAASGMVSFPPLSTSRTVAVSVRGDLVDEPNETFFLDLSSPSGATIADGQGLGTIMDDDPTPQVVVEDCAAVEGDAGTTPCVLNVTLSNPGSVQATVAWATANGTATAGADYNSNSGTLTFAPLTTGPQTITVAVRGDSAVETDETFVVNLSAPAGATLPDPQGLGTILDDDAPPLSDLEVSHGTSALRALTPGSGPAAGQHVFRMAQDPRSSYEVVADATSGDIGPGLFVERLASDNVTVLQAGSAVGTGHSRSLRWVNPLPQAVENQHVRVRSAGCTAGCGADDVYGLRVYDTTFSIPRFNNAGSQVSVLIVQNLTAATAAGHLYFWAPGGALLHTQAFSIPARGVMAINTGSIAALRGRSGAVTLAHDAGYGGLSGKAVALEPATGFSFDSPMESRARR